MEATTLSETQQSNESPYAAAIRLYTQFIQGAEGDRERQEQYQQQLAHFMQSEVERVRAGKVHPETVLPPVAALSTETPNSITSGPVTPATFASTPSSTETAGNAFAAVTEAPAVGPVIPAATIDAAAASASTTPTPGVEAGLPLQPTFTAPEAIPSVPAAPTPAPSLTETPAVPPLPTAPAPTTGM